MSQESLLSGPHPPHRHVSPWGLETPRPWPHMHCVSLPLTCQPSPHFLLSLASSLCSCCACCQASRVPVSTQPPWAHLLGVQMSTPFLPSVPSNSAPEGVPAHTGTQHCFPQNPHTASP